jgi:GTP-binding protein
MKVLFLKSGVVPKDYPFGYKPEVAIVGRSNAGKSSFLNALTGTKIAKVSATPGKTRLLNFFDLNGQIYMVDMPGYGFATGNRKEVENWRTMIETYLTERDTLCGVVLIMDIRREWSGDEEMLRQWFEYHDTPWALVLNKSDKLSRSQFLLRKAAFEKIAGKGRVYVASSMKKTGLEEIRNVLFKEWPKK